MVVNDHIHFASGYANVQLIPIICILDLLRLQKIKRYLLFMVIMKDVAIILSCHAIVTC